MWKIIYRLIIDIYRISLYFIIYFLEALVYSLNIIEDIFNKCVNYAKNEDNILLNCLYCLIIWIYFDIRLFYRSSLKPISWKIHGTWVLLNIFMGGAVFSLVGSQTWNVYNIFLLSNFDIVCNPWISIKIVFVGLYLVGLNILYLPLLYKNMSKIMLLISIGFLFIFFISPAIWMYVFWIYNICLFDFTVPVVGRSKEATTLSWYQETRLIFARNGKPAYDAYMTPWYYKWDEALLLPHGFIENFDSTVHRRVWLTYNIPSAFPNLKTGWHLYYSLTDEYWYGQIKNIFQWRHFKLERIPESFEPFIRLVLILYRKHRFRGDNMSNILPWLDYKPWSALVSNARVRSVPDDYLDHECFDELVRYVDIVFELWLLGFCTNIDKTTLV